MQVSATTDSSAVTTDFTAPTLNSVVILSSNTNSTLAANGDTVTLSFTASESIADVEVAIANVAATVSGSGTSWDATRTLDGTEPEGALSFTINFDDLTGNSGVQVSATTDSSAVTTDFTAPTLQNVTISSSNTNSTLAANGDTVTLSFTASESIADVEVAIANVAATVSGSGTSWDATRTLDGTEPEGALSFTINFDDLTGNSGVQVSATTDSSAVTTDFTAPTLNSVVILSSNTNSTLAANGDTVTLSFTASESIADVEVAIANVAATVSGSGTSWDATRTLDGTEPEGALSFTINFDDLTGNSGVQVSATTDSSAVTTDFTAPTLNSVVILSSNTNSTLAANGDTVTLSFTASESIADVEVAIANVAATVSGSGTSWDATRTLDGTEPEGALSFTINFDDLTGNSGVQVSATTDSSAVTTDFTAPTLNSVVILSSNTNSTLAANGDTVTLSFTASESIADVEVAIANVAATVSGSGTSWDATRTLDGTEPEGALSFTINFDDLTGNSGVQVSATTDSSAVTTDFTAPTLNSVVILSSNTNSTLAANGDTVTLSFTASESIADVEVAIANVAATVSGSGTSWDATRTLDGTEPEGALSFTINFDDLTGNSGVQVSATTDSSAVTTDFTAPTLNSVVILSSNTNSTLAANGDTVTLSFTASESIADVEVAIANVAATVSGSGTSWDATRTLDGTEPEGALSFTINFDDLTGNSGVQVSATTDSSAVTTDFTAPTLNSVVILSSNTNSTLAANGDTVTLSFTASESIADVEVAIANVAATVSGSGTSWDATRTLDGTEPEGALSFTINFDDLTGNSGVQVSATTDSSAVTTDFTAPTLNSVVILSSNTNSTLAANGDTVTLSFTASESIADVEVAIANVAATVSGSGTSWDATRTLDGTEPEGALSFTINFDDLTGNSGVQVSATTDSSAVTTDFTAPTLTVAATLAIVTSTSAIDSDAVKDSVTVSPLAASVLLVLLDNITTELSVGAVKSVVTALLSVVALTCTPEFPVRSSKFIVNDNAPSGSVPSSVLVASQLVPLPDTVAATLAIVTSTSAIDSDAVKDSVTVSPLAASVLLVLLDNITTELSVGAVKSVVTALLSVVALTCTPEFPVRSSKFIVNDNAPSGSVPSSVLVASQLVPLPDTVAATLAIVTSTSAIDSDAVKDSVTVSPLAASVLLVLLDNITTELSVGAVKSVVTALLSVVALTCTPEFPVRSSKFIVNDNAPSGSVPSSVLVASQLVPLPDTVAATLAIATSTSAIDSDAVKDSVTVSPLAASVLLVLLDNITTELSVGAVKSVVTALLSVVALTCTPEFPVRSSKFIVNDNAPSGSVPSSVLVASQLVPLPDTVAATLAIVTSTSAIDSDAVKDSVTVSPLAASVLLVLLDNITTELSVGAVKSVVTALLSVVALTCTGDTVTLSFTASESIADVEVAIANVAATVSGSGTSWDATRTLDGTEPEGALSFTINFDDLTGNSGVQVSATTDSSAVTTDFTAPTLNSVVILSSNTNSTLAANGDTVTLSFTASESIADVEVAIANVAATVSGSGTSWDATRTLDGTEPEGALSFTINFDDLTGNSGVQVSATTDSSAVTTDFTAPTLNSVVILSSNTNSTLAANGDTVTLSFTASESIADVEVAIANVAATVSGSGTSWDATRTLDGTEPEGALSFTINFDDLTGNSGVQVSATTDSSAVTTDFTAPTLNSVVILSSNTNSTLAANGDTVTLSFTASESIADVEVTIANVAATVSGSGTSWDATRTLDGTEPEGALSFTINFDDLTGNSGVQVSATTDSSAVTTDFTAPTLNSVVILSSNTNSTLAANGDTVTLSFTASESIADVEVTIANVAATVSGSGTSWDATRTLDGTEPEGALSFTINFDDLTGNSGVQVSATTDSSAVTTDFTAPTLNSVVILSSNTNSTLAANGDTVTLSFTASESIADVEVAIANVAATVSGSGTSWDATRTLDGTEPEGALSFTINFDDLTGNSGVQVSATTDSSAVTTDFTAPTLNSVVILSSNTNSTLAANGDTVTLSFTASESIADVEVAIANVAATVSGSGTSWDATRTLDGTEPEGALSFTINFDDLTGNSGVQVSATTDSSAVTTDFTAPTLNSVVILSSNTNSTLAANGDTVTLSFTASESIADVEVAIANVAATVSGSGTSWDATRTLDGTEPEGALSFTINFDDLTGNSGVQVSATTDSSAVTTDFTAPTLNSVVILSSNTNSTLAANGDTVTLSFTASESIADVEVTIANVAATVSGSGTSWDATRTLDGTEPEGALSFTINFDDLTGNSGVQVSATTDSSAVTTDFTAPTLNSVVILSSNTNSTLAANGDTVTLSFTASESIADVEVAIANVAATVSGSGTSWDATRTLDGTEPEGALSFTINFDDLTGNSGVQVSATTDSSAVTTDFTAPTLNSVVILSSNTNSTLAANGDTVTLSFTASESIADVEVAIANVAATVSGSGTSWDATRTLDGTEPEGALSFTINFDDLTGNSGVQVSATTDSSAVTTDFTAPTLNSVVILSSNTNSTLAANGDTVTLSFTASESIADVEVTIANVAATVSGSGTSWDATRTLDGTEPEGALSFTINFDDLTGNSGVQVSATTDSSAVTTDFTAPTLNSVVILSSNTNSTLAANGDTVTLSFTASESIADVEVTIANVAATVSGSGTSWDATRTLDGTEPEGALSFTINFDDLTGNSGVQVSATTDSSAVTTDFTAPTLNSVVILSSNTNSTLAANGDTVTLSFTASESIADVEVTIANVAATVSGSGTSWDATRTLDGTEPEGALSFTINFDDLTGNSGVQVSATTDSSAVTTDFTAPTLNSVVILSSNTNSTLAANGDTVTLSFTASESIADVEVTIANVAATVSGSGTSWDATRTLDGTEPEGALSFTINFDDLTGNSGVQVSATTDSSAVTTDFTAPTLNSVVILSSNTNSTLAANGDTVTLSFTASESIADVEVTIANVAATVSGSGTSWDATRTLDGTEPEGALSFTINFDDLTGNSGVQVSATTDSSAVTTDFTAPTLNSVVILSSNTNSTLAANGDTVTLSFTASESIADVEVTIANVAATVSGSGTSWDATRTLDGTEPEGALSFTINFDDLTGNSGVQVSATTDSSAVTTDFTAPTLNSVVILSSNTRQHAGS